MYISEINTKVYNSKNIHKTFYHLQNLENMEEILEVEEER